MVDLRVWAALCGLLRQQVHHPPPDDPTLDRASERTVHTTGYQLADMVYGVDGGENYRLLLASMLRLATTRACVHTVEPDAVLAARRVTDGYVALLGDIWLATTRLNLRTPKEWGALKGTSSLRVEIGHWSAQEVLANRSTWLDLDLMRALGAGLSGRVWVALEAWARWPQQTIDGSYEECAIGLGEPARQSLGVGAYQRVRDAHRALDRAGRRIIATDPAFVAASVEKRAGWCLVVRRVSGIKARAKARSDAASRSAGIAAGKRQRGERAVVRAKVCGSLAVARPEPF